VKHPSYRAGHTDRQTSDMVFIFLRMRLLASPFGLATNYERQKEEGMRGETKKKLEMQAYQLAAKG
jgi:hypothetical protein